MSLWRSFTGLFGGNSTADRQGSQNNEPSHRSVKTSAAVTEDSALQDPAVWACVGLLVEQIGSLPLMVYDIDGDMKTRSKSELYTILHDQPNKHQSSQEFRETMMLNLCLHGNAYARIDRVGDRIVSLWPLAAKQMQVTMLPDGEVTYEYTRENDVGVFAEKNILHIKNWGNGLMGLSPLSYARNSIGMAAAAESYSQSFFSNGGKPSGILTIDKVLTSEQREIIRQRFKSMAEGTENHHRLLVMEAGMQYQPIQIDPEKMLMLETRRHELQNICRFYRIPPILVGDSSDVTAYGAGVEQIMLAFYLTTLRPILTRWDQALMRQLLTPMQRKKISIELNADGFLRADSQGRSEFLRSMVANGLMTHNEARKKENLPPVTGGDKLTVQSNMIPLDDVGKNYGTTTTTD